MFAPLTYRDWIASDEVDLPERVADLHRWLCAHPSKPLISVIMPVYNTNRDWLVEAIGSIRDQTYQNWELCIADDASTEKHVREVLLEQARADPRIKVKFRKSNGHISTATNSAFELAKGEWIALIDHDDILRPHALAEVAREIISHPKAEIIYSDEDKISESGGRFDPYFKPEFSLELLRSQNFLNHLTVHRAANIRKVGGWRVGFEGSQDYDLSLRIIEKIDHKRVRHIPKVLYHWRAGRGSTALSADEKNYALDAGRRALQEHLERLSLAAEADFAPGAPFYRVRFCVPDPAPLVSLIIPTRDNVRLLKRCISSIQSRTSYKNYEIIIVDNGSSDQETLAYLQELSDAKTSKVLVLDIPFNYSRLNNLAVRHCGGEILALINDDIEVISPGWLSEMVSWAAQENVGCVGAKLYYEDGRIQHAGVITGLGGVAGHSHKKSDGDAPGYFYRLKIVQNVSAVTGACLVVRKSIYEHVGGLEEEHLPVAFNDVDFCLKVREAGYRNVWTPYAELYHLESVSRGSEDSPEKVRRFQSEVEYMKDRWKLVPDPFYSPNLTLNREDFSFAP
ncbi:glycosyltransferase family 2 protein [Nitratireductor aquimarinus]|uniref:Glycosyltransferase family 2 protein n=1 Tax=Nitratireductor aquimarinus TaxID=889300 RepID=A0ABU4ANJ0_9HYPH|nr:glycosyltransferase family 2 protein [Nitratireductor aquimarinus]MDV6227813.1 glycosyltransferase family 2 protein [Nitratireductor aquimarinus]